MKIRHKTPTLVSMWMLDVFCCALGCVTLLWLLKTREAGEVVAQNTSIRADLNDARVQLSDATTAALQLGAQLDETNGQLALVRDERDAAARRLALAEEEVKNTSADLKIARATVDETKKKVETARRALTAMQARAQEAEDELAKKRDELATLTRKAETAAKTAEELQTLVRDKERARAEAAQQAAELSRRIDDAGMRAENRMKALERDLRAKSAKLDEANAQIIDLQGTKAKLADKYKQLQVESDQRFAGIATTGKRVVFLVDMSGSMDRTDENTVEPTKWPTVRATLLKVMRSLPDLEKYQVILFSTKVQYLMTGTEGKWLDYDKKSPEAVNKALTATKPEGDTNMYAAFEEAFRFREQGMDTVYLFSDGLPTSGPGLTRAQESTVTDQTQRSDLLGRYIRRLLKTDWNASNPRLNKVRINSIGFYYESPDLGAFLWALSRENDGNFVGMSRP